MCHVTMSDEQEQKKKLNQRQNQTVLHSEPDCSTSYITFIAKAFFSSLTLTVNAAAIFGNFFLVTRLTISKLFSLAPSATSAVIFRQVFLTVRMTNFSAAFLLSLRIVLPVLTF